MSDVFNSQPQRYDAWYDTPEGSAVLGEEVEALRPLLDPLSQPWLEVGVGTGRFATALGVDVGIDPAPATLSLAASRGIRSLAARGETLPFPDRSFGACLLVVTLCFVADPLGVLKEARRVLRPGGGVVLGLVLAEGPLGRYYRHLAEEGHAYYRLAHFFSRPELSSLLSQAGFRPVRTRSALFGSPESGLATGTILDEDHPEAGFTAVLAC